MLQIVKFYIYYELFFEAEFYVELFGKSLFFCQQSFINGSKP